MYWLYSKKKCKNHIDELFSICHDFLSVWLLASKMEDLFSKCQKISQNVKKDFDNKPLTKLGEVNNNLANLEDKNPQDKVGKTPLHYAAEDGKFTICQQIVDKIGELFLHLLPC